MSSLLFTPSLFHFLFSFLPLFSSPPTLSGPSSSIKSDTLTIIFTGDILLDRGVRRPIARGGVESLFSLGVQHVLATSNLVIGNLECPATHIREPVFKRFVFRAEPEWLSVLSRYGFTHLNLANNHSIDQGRQALQDTRHNISQAGMTPVGAGQTMAEAAAPVKLSAHPRPVYLIASLRLPLENYAYLPHRPCVSQEPEDSLLTRVRRLRMEHPQAYLIVCLHWGREHELQPTVAQRQLAHQLVEAGTDLLVGHHSHTLQTIEDYRGSRIYYSIGNFIFDQSRPLNTRACLVRLRLTNRSATVETLPIEIHHCVPWLIGT